VKLFFVQLILAAMPTAMLAAPTGGFLAVLNERRNLGDSMNSVTFFDADAPSLPLFSVYVGREPTGSNEWEEPTALTVNPVTGEVYLIAFDSGDMAGVDDSAGDTERDLDLLRIDFPAIYDHWVSNIFGRDAQAQSLVVGPVPSGVNNAANFDYVTYANTAADFNPMHSNQLAFPGSVEKIGQVNRGNGDDFFEFALEFINDETLIMLDDSIGLANLGDAADDHTIRIIERTSTSPEMSSSTLVDRGGAGSNYFNGGYNGTLAEAATESWSSRVIEHAGAPPADPFLIQLDGSGHSEPESMAYYYDPDSGVRGVWISEGDSPAAGDVLAFVELDANNQAVGYRPQVGVGNPLTLTLSNDPAVGDLNGKIDNFFIDQDTGDLIIIESGFNDQSGGIGPDHEPGVLRVSVDYDNGSGQISFGAWQTKKFLSPTKDTNDTFLERGAWTVYDSVTDTVYFFAPGASGETPANEMDIFALSLATGATTSYLNVDDAVNLSFSDSFGDKAVFIDLGPSLIGDYNSDGFVNAADYTVWRNSLNATISLPNEESTTTPGMVTMEDYFVWKNYYGASAGSGASDAVDSQVPEPGSIVLITALLIFASRFTPRRSPAALR
jgi:hypothetical protein